MLNLDFVTILKLFTTEFSISVFLLTLVLFPVAALWYNTILLNRSDLQKLEMEKALKESREQAQAILESAPDGVIVINKEGRVIELNKQAELIFGWTIQEVWYKELANLIFPPRFREAYKQGLQNFINTGKSEMLNTAFELKGLCKDKTEIDISLHLSPAILKNKYMLVGFVRDITEKKKAEKSVKQSYEDIRRLASHQEKISDEERISIAREIHDELGQQLTVLKMDISWLNKNIFVTEEKIVQRMNDLREMIDQTIKTVRRISSRLRPGVLDDLGLLPALEWLSDDFEKRSGVRTKFISEISDPGLDAGINTALFKFFQESLTNIAKHAQASEVYASLKNENGKLIMTIKDNGKGFAVSAIENKKTLGILGIKERLALLHGEYDIISSPGQGATVTVMVPVSSITEPKTSL